MGVMDDITKRLEQLQYEVRGSVFPIGGIGKSCLTIRAENGKRRE